MKQIIFAITLFTFGIFTSEFTHHFMGEAEAEVAGMSYYDLRRDRDFKKAVEWIVDDNYIQNAVSGNCYIDGGYVYC